MNKIFDYFINKKVNNILINSEVNEFINFLNSKEENYFSNLTVENNKLNASFIDYIKLKILFKTKKELNLTNEKINQIAYLIDKSVVRYLKYKNQFLNENDTQGLIKEYPLLQRYYFSKKLFYDAYEKLEIKDKNQYNSILQDIEVANKYERNYFLETSILEALIDKVPYFITIFTNQSKNDINTLNTPFDIIGLQYYDYINSNEYGLYKGLAKQNLAYYHKFLYIYNVIDISQIIGLNIWKMTSPWGKGEGIDNKSTTIGELKIKFDKESLDSLDEMLEIYFKDLVLDKFYNLDN